MEPMAPENDYPLYRSHKLVRAVRIQAIDRQADGGVHLKLADGFGDKQLDAAYAERITPGDDLGYYVKYGDGYESWSPTLAFESGYTRVTTEE
jgi:hypothetical protein